MTDEIDIMIVFWGSHSCLFHTQLAKSATNYLHLHISSLFLPLCSDYFIVLPCKSLVGLRIIYARLFLARHAGDAAVWLVAEKALLATKITS
jgi:hypothetical protein